MKVKSREENIIKNPGVGNCSRWFLTIEGVSKSLNSFLIFVLSQGPAVFLQQGLIQLALQTLYK